MTVPSQGRRSKESLQMGMTLTKVGGSSADEMDIPSNIFSIVILETWEGKMNWVRPSCCFVLLT